MLGINKAANRPAEFRGQIVRQTGQALLMMLLTRATLFGDLSPFAVAWFCAAIYSGASPWAMLIGCALGCPWEILGVYAVTPPAGCLLALGLGAALRRIPGLSGENVRKGRLGGEDVLICILAALGGLIPPLAMTLLLTDSAFSALLTALLSGITAMAFAPVFKSISSLRLRRTRLLTEELLALAIVTMLCLSGLFLSPLKVVSAPCAGLLALIAAYAGPTHGAAAGIIGGTALALASGDPLIGASIGLMGLIAGSVMPLGRFWACCAFLLVNLSACAFGASGTMGTLHPLGALGASALFLLIPQSLISRFSSWLSPYRDAVSADELAFQLRQSSEKKLRALSAVFSELADSYGFSPPAPDEQMLVSQMRRCLCAGCPGYANCWNEGDGLAGRLLCRLLGESLSGKTLTENEEVPAEWGRVCRRAAEIPRKIGPLLRSFASQRHSVMEKRSESGALGRHFAQAAHILSDIGDVFSRPLHLDEHMSCIAAAALEQAGFDAGHVMTLDGDTLEIAVALKDGLWSRNDASLAADAVSQAAGVPFRPVFSGNDWQSTLHLIQSPRLSATVGYASRPRHQGIPNGDAHLTAGLTGGKILMALSDGMGSGVEAAQESEATIRLVKRFLMAGIDDHLMLDTINQLLLLRSSEEMYATADLCVIDLQEGQAFFTKLGACASFLIRRGNVRRIDGGRLPLGILDSVTPMQYAFPLRAGDTLVMITDGIADCASEEQNLWLEKLLSDLPPMQPAALCEKIIHSVCALSDGAKDDMTVMAARIGRVR